MAAARQVCSVRRRLGRPLLALVSLLSFPAWAHAQGCTAGRAGTFRLRVQPAVIAFDPPGPADFEAGRIDAQREIRIDVRPEFGGGSNWTLCIRSDSPDAGGYGKPTSDFEWQLAGDVMWTPLETANRLVYAGRNRRRVILLFRTVLDWGRDEPGDYGLPLTLTAYRQ
ncbi:MAG: hypothetical protein ACE5JR_01345 [Gemmatimonadota bacterium]